MVNKQSDPVYILAETIIDSVQQIATSKTDKAAYDKTYSAIILGTNQKFVDDVSEQDKTAIIEKFSIPEAVEEGEQTYYTFKINGAYYCKRQNGNFNLYDNIMVYIPNGDWSNMYFDYPDASSHGGGGGGSSTEGHQLIVSVDEPGGEDPQLGDMWLFVRDETRTTFSELEPSDYVGMYTWQEDEDTEVRSWKSALCTVGGTNPPSDGNVGDFWIKLENGLFSKIYLCTANGSATVWSEIYPDDETGMGYNLFISADKPLSADDIWISIDDEETRKILGLYQYKYNTSTNSFEWVLGGISESTGGVGENVGDHNERFNGYVNGTDGHIIRSGDYNHAEGFKNTIQSESYSHAEGYQNTAQGGNYNHIEGDYNTLTASNRTHVGGFRNTVTGASCSIVSGYMNIASGSISYDIISGVSNEVYNVDRAIVIGDSNFVAAISSAIVCGQYADTRTITTPDNGDLRFLIGGSQALGNVLYITHKGNVYARGSYNSTGADYAEYFEWADGNPDSEDRRGMLVALDGDKITLAHGDDIFGIISANPSIVGNNPIEWHGKYKRDVFGSLVLDENGEPILNPDYDPEKQYIPREQRPEWAAVGIVGKLIIVDNGTCKPNGYVSARNGIGTANLSPTNIRVLRRVDDKHVEVFIK